MDKKQVEKDHYTFGRYVDKERWASFWHQLDEVMRLSPSNVLEVGPGPGLFKILGKHFGINVKSLDIDPEMNSDYISSATELPFPDDTFDCVCSFQMLEHLPYEKSIEAFREMVRVAKKDIVISLPDAQILWTYSFHIPKKGKVTIHIPRPRLYPEEHVFNGEHYWEINKKGYSLNCLVEDFLQCGAHLYKTFRVDSNTYHRFFVFNKK